MSETIDQMRRIFEQALALAERKNADYGDAWRDQGWRGNISRVFEKTKRLRTILWSGKPVDARVEENVEETAIDMVNTLVFFILNKQAGVEWGHETPYHFVTGIDYGYPEEISVTSGSEVLRPETLEAIHDGLTGSTPTEIIPTLEPAAAGELPVRNPGQALQEVHDVARASADFPEDANPTGVGGETLSNRKIAPSPNRRVPNRK